MMSVKQKIAGFFLQQRRKHRSVVSARHAL
jgi:hypothetical protein